MTEKSRTQQAIDLLLADHSLTPHAAALKVGISPTAILMIDEAVSIIEPWTDAHALKEELQEWMPKAKAVLENHT